MTVIRIKLSPRKREQSKQLYCPRYLMLSQHMPKTEAVLRNFILFKNSGYLPSPFTNCLFLSNISSSLEDGFGKNQPTLFLFLLTLRVKYWTRDKLPFGTKETSPRNIDIASQNRSQWSDHLTFLVSSIFSRHLNKSNMHWIKESGRVEEGISFFL